MRMFYNKFAFICVIASFIGLGFSSLDAKPIQIVSVMEDFSSIAKSVGGDLVITDSLVTGSKNLHNIQAKPSMVLKVRKADLLIRLGMDQDKWVDGLIQVAKNNQIFYGQQGYLDASDRVEKLEVPDSLVDGSMGDIHIQGNPHYWLNPENGKVIARQICDRLQQIDPENKDEYETNYLVFAALIDEKMIEWSQSFNYLKNMQILTFHKAWSYFFDAFGLESKGELEPLPGIPPTTKHLLALEANLNSSTQPILIISTIFYPKRAATNFSKKMDASYKRLSSNVGDNGINSYIDLFDYLSQELRQ